MAQTSIPNPADGRVVTDLQFENMARGWGPDGVHGWPSDQRVIFGDSTGRHVKIRAGSRATVGGHLWMADTAADEVVPLAANSSGLTRKDLVVLRLDRTTWNVSVVPLVGTPATTPTVPVLTQSTSTTGVWDIPLAAVTVRSGAVTIASTDVEWAEQRLGAQIVWTADYASLGWLPNLKNGQLAFATGSTMMLHYWSTSAGSWRRLDWNNPWGDLGGWRYNAGSALCVGIVAYTGIDYYAGMQTGTVTLVAGRRYRVEASVRFQTFGIFPNPIFSIREGSNAGLHRIEMVLSEVPGGAGLQRYIHAEFDETSNRSVNFVLTGKGLSGSGSMDILRPTSGDVYMKVTDLGPSRLTTV